MQPFSDLELVSKKWADLHIQYRSLVDSSKTAVDSTLSVYSIEALKMIGNIIDDMREFEESIERFIQERGGGNNNLDCITQAQNQLSNASLTAGEFITMRTQLWYEVTHYFYEDGIGSFLEELELFMIMMPMVTWLQFPYHNPVTEFENIIDTLSRGATAVETDFEAVIDIMLVKFLYFEIVVMNLNNKQLLEGLNEAFKYFQVAGGEIEISLTECISTIRNSNV